MIILNTLQVILLIYLFLSVIGAVYSYNIRITNYGLALSILFLLLNIGSIILSRNNIGVYIGIGLCLSLLFDLINSIKIDNMRTYSRREKIIIILLIILFWMPIISLLVFYFKNYNKIYNENIQ